MSEINQAEPLSEEEIVTEGKRLDELSPQAFPMQRRWYATIRELQAERDRLREAAIKLVDSGGKHEGNVPFYKCMLCGQGSYYKKDRIRHEKECPVLLPGLAAKEKE